MKPQQITTLEQLASARAKRQSVYVPKMFVWTTPRPAAVVLNLSGEQLLRMFMSGMFVYQKPVKKGRKRTVPNYYMVKGTHPTNAPFSETVYSWHNAAMLKRAMNKVGYEITIDPPTKQPARK